MNYNNNNPFPLKCATKFSKNMKPAVPTPWTQDLTREIPNALLSPLDLFYCPPRSRPLRVSKVRDHTSRSTYIRHTCDVSRKVASSIHKSPLVVNHIDITKKNCTIHITKH